MVYTVLRVLDQMSLRMMIGVFLFFSFKNRLIKRCKEVGFQDTLLIFLLMKS